jgi:uroporphyrinogen-III synthase
VSSILSTKILSLAQKELLLNANQSFVEYDAIKIDFVPFKIDFDYDYFVFTSQNGVKSFLKKAVYSGSIENRAFCVGEKTKSLLQENGLKVIEMAKNSKELGQIISKTYKNSSFLVFSGNLRRPELPEVLNRNEIRFKEIEAYRTGLNYKKFDRGFDSVLFFSPSGVTSYIHQNQLKDSLAICIGDTTAKEAKKYTKQIRIATKPTIENVLVKAVKHFKHND